MRKYIETDKLKQMVEHEMDMQDTYLPAHFFDIVDDMPAADVQEVRHGRWEDGKRMGFDGTFHWFRQCSECLYEREDDNPDKDTNYCPNCGSRMDLEGDIE